ERLHGMQEVRGSIPRSSTIFRKKAPRPPHRGGLFVCLSFGFPMISPFAFVWQMALHPVREGISGPGRC
ncbi:hypothetical protein, partial [Aeromonas caviae]|uniref:hypothetical protein n=1 Tax=Aeromonas caviae TaxID=648 RepID=UPI0028DD53DC